ncbi:MAG: hypothetical protein JXB36_09155 [Gammaproteobacteria bacterium]|nr:hypothetical protein [Gammaproteobacteria bacterium]
MRTRHRLAGLVGACVLAVLSMPAGAQQDVSGTWAGKLAVAPDTELDVHFVLTRTTDGAYTAMVTSPDPGGIKDVAASAVSFDGSTLSVTVDALSGAYEGTLADGRITGEWRQQGTAIPLALMPYEAPVLSQAEIDLLLGQWTGKLTAGAELTIVFRFETGEAGELVGFVDSPDQGVRGIPISNIELADGELTFRIPRVNGVYTATVDGEAMTGTWTQGQPLPLNMTRGELAPSVPSLDLSAEDLAALEGEWRGMLDVPGPDGQTRALELSIRIEETESGESVGYLDVPAQGVSDLPVSALSFADDGRLTISFLSLRAAFAGDVSGDEAVGTWTQGPLAVPLTLRRD